MDNFSPELDLIRQILINSDTPPVTVNWQYLYTLSIRHRVTHQVYQYYQKHNLPIGNDLTEYCHKDKLRILSTIGETIRIANQFNKLNISYAVVKGIILNAHIYNDINSRSCRDIDVWVDISQYKQAMDALYSMGYITQRPDYNLEGYKEEYYLTHRHDMEFYHPDRRVLVELHFSLNYLGINYFSLSDSVLHKVKVLNTDIYTLDDNYHLLYLMLHGSVHAYSRIRWLNDIAQYIKSNKCDLNIVLMLASKINARHIVLFSLILVQDIWGINTAIIAMPDKQANYLAKLCKEFISADYELVDGIGSSFRMFTKYRWYLCKLAVKGSKLNALIGDLFKIDNLFTHLTLPRQICFMYYVFYPLWVIKYLCKGLIKRYGVNKI
jgi:hypothetical protein